MDPLQLNENNPDILDFMSSDVNRPVRETAGGRSTMPLDELRIVRNLALSLEDKAERLTALGRAKTTRRAAARRAARFPHLALKTFDDRISSSDQIRARGLGILLD